MTKKLICRESSATHHATLLVVKNSAQLLKIVS